MRKTSLSRQMIGGVLLAELVCAATFSFLAVQHEMHVRRRGFDVMLRGRADSVLGAVQDAEDADDTVKVDPTELAVPKRDAYEVMSPAGRVLGNSPGSSAGLLAALSTDHNPGYFNFQFGGDQYRAIRFTGVRIIDREVNGGQRHPVVVLYAAPTRETHVGGKGGGPVYVFAGVGLLAGTGLALIWFLRRRLSPLDELATIAGRVSARSWEFVPPDAVLRTTELEPIASSIGHLLKGLREAFERQRQMTGDSAHELKTSIAVVKSSLQLLSMSPRTTRQYEAGLEGLLIDTERMEELANRMLALARLEEAPVEEGVSANLQAALEVVAARLRPLAESRQVTLTVGAGEARWVTMHADDAEVLCSNLMLNALQHSSPGGEVSARVGAAGADTELIVTDRGEGIPEAALPQVFARFYRADRSRSRNSGGAGLGLSICKAIVERAGGSVEIRSVVGEGTQVHVVLPAFQGEAQGESSGSLSEMVEVH